MSKHAFLLLSPPENPGKIADPLEYAAQLDEAGHEVVVWFDGGSTSGSKSCRTVLYRHSTPTERPKSAG